MIQELLGGSSDIFGVVGALTTGLVTFKVALGVFRFITAYFLSGLFGLGANVKKAGSWAVVTGATDGIGKAYAERLAAKGMNIVLISRTQSKLEDAGKEIESKFKVSTRIIAVDFSQPDIYDGIATDLEGLDIGVLVNNVGCSYDHPEYFGQVDSPDFVRRMINMNCTSVAKMSQIVLPSMLQKKTGYIINIGSSAGTHPSPLLSLYSGTKAFVEFFSRSLHLEYSGQGITVQCIKPYFVVSKLSKFRKASAFVPSPSSFAKSALNTLGMQSVTTGYWSHAIQDVYMNLIPSSVVMNFMKQARSKALAKKAASAKAQ